MLRGEDPTAGTTGALFVLIAVCPVVGSLLSLFGVGACLSFLVDVVVDAAAYGGSKPGWLARRID